MFKFPGLPQLPPWALQVASRADRFAGFQELMTADAPELLAPPPVPAPLRELLIAEAAAVEIPAVLLAALGAVLTGWRPSYYDGFRSGILGVPRSLLEDAPAAADPDDPAAIARGVQLNVRTAARYLREMAARPAGLPGAIVAYLEAGEPDQLPDVARRLAARRLAAAVVGCALVFAGGELRDEIAAAS